MLKIKDSVDLKELKKFGIFEYWGYWNKDEFTKNENVVESSLYVHTRTRIMKGRSCIRYSIRFNSSGACRKGGRK